MLRSNGMLLVREKDCEARDETTSSLLHAMHVPLLQTLCEVPNQILSGRLLIPPPELRWPQELTLPFFGQNLSKILAANKAAGYSLAKLAESLENKSVVHHTPADAIVHEVMERPRAFWALDISSWMSWMSYLMYAITIILLVLWYSTHRRLTILATALSVTAGRAKAFEIKDEFKLTMTTLPSSVDMTAVLNSIIA
jgi:hypothetical protein